jgi:hypothetical protein
MMRKAKNMSFLQTYDNAPASLINVTESTFEVKNEKAVNKKSNTPVKELKAIEE